MQEVTKSMDQFHSFYKIFLNTVASQEQKSKQPDLIFTRAPQKTHSEQQVMGTDLPQLCTVVALWVK